MGISVTGGEASWIAGDFAQYVGNGIWGGIFASFLETSARPGGCRVCRRAETRGSEC